MPNKLKKYNSFRIDVSCLKRVSIFTKKDFVEYAGQDAGRNYKILGGGSNVLLTSDLDCDVLINKIKGINIQRETDEDIFVEVGAGEMWHNFVMWTVSHDLGGLENMALIPGTVGAAPIQNIGAYGVEQKDSFVSLKAIDKESLKERIFTNMECMFGYRDSYFKNAGKDKFFITSVTYRLIKNSVPNTSYKDVSEWLAKRAIDNPTVPDVASAVIDIRRQKLPDPAEIGNAGSFFKNPVVEQSTIDMLSGKYSTMPYYPMEHGKFKLAAGWLIDQCGYKGVRVGNTGTYKNQALVIVNYGGATGEEIKAFSEEIQQAVLDKFNIRIEPEVNIW